MPNLAENLLAEMRMLNVLLYGDPGTDPNPPTDHVGPGPTETVYLDPHE